MTSGKFIAKQAIPFISRNFFLLLTSFFALSSETKMTSPLSAWKSLVSSSQRVHGTNSVLLRWTYAFHASFSRSLFSPTLLMTVSSSSSSSSLPLRSMKWRNIWLQAAVSWFSSRSMGNRSSARTSTFCSKSLAFPLITVRIARHAAFFFFITSLFLFDLQIRLYEPIISSTSIPKKLSFQMESSIGKESYIKSV